MATDFRGSLAGDAPPAEVSAALQALWWLKKGGFAVGPEWERAHEIAQGGEGERIHDLVHALVHWIEGDHGNAAYWYRRADSADARAATKDAEWERIVAMMEH
jgi:hypothetical protein